MRTTYVCSKCGRTSDKETRPHRLDHYHMSVGMHMAITMCSVEEDKGRPVGDGYYLKGEEVKYDNLTEEEKAARKHTTPTWLRREPAKDLVLKITIPDHPKDPYTPFETATSFFDALAYLRKEKLDKEFACRLTDGHDWVEQLPVAP